MFLFGYVLGVATVVAPIVYFYGKGFYLKWKELKNGQA